MNPAAIISIAVLVIILLAGIVLVTAARRANRCKAECCEPES